MSYKKSIVKFAIKKTPKKMILWVANKKAKGIAKLTDFRFNSNEGKLYTQLRLSGDEELVELWLEDFTLTPYKQSFRLTIHQIQSNRPWLDSLLKNFVLEREWKVPDKHADLIHYLLALDNSGQEENSE